MVERKPLSKKIRFEVFKRDSFTCQYCGQKAPDVILEVDHITPVSKGGKNEILNLITSCFDCNRGKSNRDLKNAPKSITENNEQLKEKSAQLKEYQKYVKSIDKIYREQIEMVNEAFTDSFPEKELTYSFKNSSVKKFIKLLGVEEVVDSMNVACSRVHYKSDQAIKYFCGICWKKIKGE